LGAPAMAALGAVAPPGKRGASQHTISAWRLARRSMAPTSSQAGAKCTTMNESPRASDPLSAIFGPDWQQAAHAGLSEQASQELSRALEWSLPRYAREPAIAD